jgi:NAD(P)-dependent dehydrogenase (short-subunit alcohol dehydrogenase family)
MRVLISGCSTGIGRATAVELAERGHEVIATARRPASLAGLPAAAKLALDINDDGSVRDCLAAAGRVDVLVNNAGIDLSGPVERVPLDAARRLLETNVLGTARMIQAVAPAMRERGSGAIVNVSSIAGRVGAPLKGFYSASKFALEGLSEVLHFELGHFGVRVAIVELGYFATALAEKSTHYGLDEPPYDALERLWGGSEGTLTDGARPGPELAARGIADAVEGGDDKLRWRVGDDAELVLGARASLDDEAFEAAMRKTLGLEEW